LVAFFRGVAMVALGVPDVHLTVPSEGWQARWGDQARMEWVLSYM
jgi:hypothetical protein